MGDKLRRFCPLCSSKEYAVLYGSTFSSKNHLNAEVFSARRQPDRIHGTIVKCTKCGLVRTLEIINPEKLKSLYQKSSFTYQGLVDNLRRSYGRILQDASSHSAKGAFLEIGCGNGFMLGEAKKIGFKRVIGIEPSIDAVKQSSAKIKSCIIVDILKRGILKRNSVDLIAAFQVFDHISNPNTFIKICHSILKPNGILLLMNHDVEAFLARLLGEKNPIFDIEHAYLYSPRTITSMVEKNGFSTIRVYGPKSVFSLRYLLRLLPFPETIKKTIEKLMTKVLDNNIQFNPGNLAIYARK